MMISPLADTSPFKLDPWRMNNPQLDAKLRTTVPQYSLHASPKAGPVANQNKYRFLIVDDNEINLRIFRRVLKKLFPNSYIDTLQDSCQIEPAQLSSYKIVFLDIEMPKVTGVEIASAVRSRAALDKLGLIAVTTKSTAADLKIYEQCGFDMTIPKPVHRGYAGILRDIESVLQRRCGEDVECPMLGADVRTPDLVPDTETDAYETFPENVETGFPGDYVSSSGGAAPRGPDSFLGSSAATAVSELLLAVTSCDSVSF